MIMNNPSNPLPVDIKLLLSLCSSTGLSQIDRIVVEKSVG